jgi:hypothetical protein
VVRAPERCAWSILLCNAGPRMLTLADDGTVQVWDGWSGAKLQELKHTAKTGSTALSMDGLHLATASGDTIRIWDARTGVEERQFKDDSGVVTMILFSPNDQRLATVRPDGTVCLWDFRTGEKRQEFKANTGSVTCLWFSPDGDRLATVGQDLTGRGNAPSTAWVWDARNGKKLGECNVEDGSHVSFSPDGRFMAVAPVLSRTAILRDLRTGDSLRFFMGHNGYVRSVSFSPDGRRLATGGEDRTVILWDVRTGKPLLELKGHTDTVTGVAFSPDGNWLASVSDDRTARLWDARPVPLPSEEERKERLWATQAEPDWHEEQFKQYQEKDRFVAAFHLDRMLAYRPEQRSELLRQRTVFLESSLKQNDKDASARLLLARTAWHSPALGPRNAAAFLPPADEKGLLQRRTRGGLLLRQGKAAEAVTVLEVALKDRGDDQPPVEELLLAWAYLDTKQTEKAKTLWTKAMAWLDLGQEAMSAANVAGTPPGHSRYNAFDWETWHEIDVLRRELMQRLGAKNP